MRIAVMLNDKVGVELGELTRLMCYVNGSRGLDLQLT